VFDVLKLKETDIRTSETIKKKSLSNVSCYGINQQLRPKKLPQSSTEVYMMTNLSRCSRVITPVMFIQAMTKQEKQKYHHKPCKSHCR
jgi:PIN domain nuclease of toxin-antitoxin system